MLVAAALGAIAHRITQRLFTTHGFKDLFIPAAVAAIPTVLGVYFAWLGYTTSSGRY